MVIVTTAGKCPEVINAFCCIQGAGCLKFKSGYTKHRHTKFQYSGRIYTSGSVYDGGNNSRDYLDEDYSNDDYIYRKESLIFSHFRKSIRKRLDYMKQLLMKFPSLLFLVPVWLQISLKFSQQ